MKIYSEDIRKRTLKMGKRDTGSKEWFSRCGEARERREVKEKNQLMKEMNI